MIYGIKRLSIHTFSCYNTIRLQDNESGSNKQYFLIVLLMFFIRIDCCLVFHHSQ